MGKLWGTIYQLCHQSYPDTLTPTTWATLRAGDPSSRISLPRSQMA